MSLWGTWLILLFGCERALWRRTGVWDQIMEALAAGHNATVQMSKPFSPTSSNRSARAILWRTSSTYAFASSH
jgi:hypothetical protein